MKKLYLLSLFSCLCFASNSQTTFTYSGSVQTYTVPTGVTAISVDMQGAKGGDNNNWPSGTYPSQGGNGGRVQATLTVTPGQILYIFVGGAGGAGTTAAGTPGYNGGGAGGVYSTIYSGGGGGGATDIRIGGTALSNIALVAGGGGGAGLDYPGGNMERGGAGGGLTGGNGYWDGVSTGGEGGFGGTQTSGGASGSGGGTSGSIGTGGDAYTFGGSGGGGGGYYGGGGGGSSWAAGGGGSSYSDGSLAFSVVHTQAYNSTGDGSLVLTPLSPCSGTVTSGSASAFPSSGGSSTYFSISLTGATTGTGLTYQWQSSPDGSTWSSISGATSPTYTFTGVTANIYFNCIITCSASSSSATSSSVLVTYILSPTCLPTSSSWYMESGEITYGANAFNISGYSGSTLSDGGLVSAANASSPSTGYLDHTSSVSAINLQQGGSYSSSVTWGTTSPHQYAQAWIDFNDDGTFQSTEEVSAVSGWNASTTPQPTIFNINIPTTAPTGTHLMRLRAIWEENSTDIGSAPLHCDPCLINYGGVNPSYWSGDVIDYLANIIALPACSGTPAMDTAITSLSIACPSTSFSLSLNGPAASGLTYQWQSSPDSASWTNISGATSVPYATTESAATYYRCVVTCTSSSLSTASSGVKVNYLSACPCTPAFYYSCSYLSMYTGITSLTGEAGTSITDASNCTPSTTASYYDEYSITSVTLQAGNTYSATIAGGSYYYSSSAQVWIDFNDNGTFESTETVGGITYPFTSYTEAASLVIPSTANTGTHRMRIVANYNCCGGSTYPTIDPCPTTSISYGDAKDYSVTIIPPPPTVVATPSSLSFGAVTVGTSSPAETFSVSGSYLIPTSGNLTVNAPSSFQVSSDGTTWVSTYYIAYTGSTVPSTTNVYVRMQPTAYISYSGNVTITGGGLSTTVNVPVSGVGATACSGIPTAGTTVVSPTSGGIDTTFTLSLSGATALGGLTYQWQSSPTGAGTWTNIAGATTVTYTFIGITSSTDYQCIITCPSYTSSTSSVATATFIPVPSCLPTSSSWYSESGEITYGADAFNVIGFGGSTLSDASMVSAASSASPTTGYLDRTTSMSPLVLEQSGSYASSVTWGSTSPHQYAQAWIDFNNDGTFQSSEEVSPVSGWDASATPQPTTFNISVPLTADTGIHLMRLRAIWEENSTDIGSAPAHCDPCLINYGGAYPDYWSGDVIDYMVRIVALPPCSGTPSAGAATTTVAMACPSLAFTLNITGTAAAGMTYQWQSSADTITWTNISGATTVPYTTTESSALYYRCTVTCTASGLSATSSNVFVGYISGCYCTPSYYFGSPATYNALSNFTLNGYGTSVINDDGPTSIPGSGYEDRTSISIDLQQNGSYSGSITYTNTYYEFEDQVWIDFNDNGTFETSEEVTPDFGVTGCSTFGSSATFSLNIPLTATPGMHRMRVRQAETYNCTPETDMDPCNSISSFSGDYYYYGCTRDYTANIIALPACTGTPTPGDATTSVTPVCPSGSFTLNFTGTAATGLAFQWQSSTDSMTWTNISGATTMPYTTTESVSTFYRCVITCTASGLSATTSGVHVIQLTACYCIPSYYYGSPATYDALSNFSLSGYAGTSINDDGPTTIPSSGYEDRTSISINLQQNGSYSGSITYDAYGNEFEDQVWIDFNDNGTFETTEEVTPDFGVTGCSSWGNSATYTLTIPFTANPGSHRMRVRQAETYTCTVEPHMDPCNSISSFSGDYYYYGCTRDYTAIIIPLPACTGTPTAGAVTSSLSTGCTPYTTTLTDTGSTLATGLTYQWQSSPDGSTWTNVTGATDLTYTASVSSTVYYRFVITCTSSGLSSPTASVNLLLTPAPGPISCTSGGAPGGPFALCYTTTTASFSGAASGGTWSNSPTTYGTVFSSTGAWTPSGSTGTTTISYTIGSCTATATLSINSLPPATPTIASGTNPVCTYSTLNLTDAVTGGVWSSTNTTIATVSSTGLVTGTGNGVDSIGYNDGCGISYYVVTVNGSAISITPTSSNICDGTTLNLTATYLTGTGTSYSWAGPGGTSGTTALTVSSVSPTDAGTYTFTTTTSSTTGSCSESVSVPIIVLPAPAIVLTPTSFESICAGTSTSVTASTILTPTGATILAQNFNSGLTGQIGGDWTITNISGTTTSEWSIRTSPGYSYIVYGDGSSYMEAAPDAYYSTTNTLFTSPSFSTVGYTSANLTFNYYFDQSSSYDTQAEIDYSTDGGTTWNVLYDYMGTGVTGSTSWSSGTPNQTIALPTGAIGQPSVQIRWNYVSVWGFYWAVDNIQVTAAPTMIYAWAGSAGVTDISCSACATATLTPTTTGTNIYSVTVTAGSCATTALDTVTVNPLPSAITGTSTLCIGGTSTFTDALTGGTWSSSNTSIASVDALLGVVTGVSAGVATITYTSAFGCSVTMNVTIGSYLPSPIAGITTACIGGTTTLTDSVSGGTWSSSNTSIATVSSTTGVVTGVAAGTATITYTSVCGVVITNVTIGGAAPGAISGSTSICTGSSATFTDASTGGVWTTSSTAIAAIGSSSGIAIGVSSGIATITYTSGCGFSTASLTVNGIPAFISGTPSLCTSGITVLTDSTSGGTWSISSSSVATIGSLTGVVNGVMPGVDTVVYTTTCGSRSVSITVNGSPAPITGSLSVCALGVDTLSDITTGGTWTSSNFGVATVGSTSGIVSGMAAGVVTISYTTLCGTSTASVTVNSASPLPISGGTSPICALTATTLSDVSSGGSWSSASPSTATVSTSGIVTGAVGGTAIISYSTGCGIPATTVVTVNPLPSIISGSSSICMSSSELLSDSVAGGTWSSSASGIVSVVPISGFITGSMAGTATITYTTACGFATKSITVNNAAPSPISGTDSVCTGNSVTLTDAATGGTWSSSFTGIATVGATTGVVSGLAAGLDTIVYSTGCGIPASVIINVRATPMPITGNLILCASSVDTLYDVTTGGSWSSSSTSVASINSSGIVSGLSSGMSIISYSTASCGTSTATVTVDAPPSSISGSNNICVGGTSILSDSVFGGTWSSSNPSVAIVNSSLGIVTGIAAGVVNITYTTNCGSAFMTITVNGSPASITGFTHLCIGSVGTLSDVTTGGTWSSNASGIASVGTTTGVINGIASGITVITYATGCGYTTTDVTVNSSITISGNANVCVGGTDSLTDASLGGLWYSSSTSVATIDSVSGVVSGTGVGTATITYNSGALCGISEKSITVNGPPAAITGGTTVCVGNNLMLSDVSLGGSWSVSSTAIAVVSASSGILSGVSSGVVICSYTTACGISTSTITVNAAPASIIGNLPVCSGSSISLTDSTSGGSWSSGSSAIASINSSGVVTGVSSGTVNVTYNNGCLPSAVANITVNALPGAIAGPSYFCFATSAMYTDATTGGVWSSSNVAVDSFVTGTGTLIGVGVGYDTIYYTSPTTGCYSMKTISVQPLASLATGILSGFDTVCLGATITLTDSITGTVTSTMWSSSDTSILSVNATGVVTGHSAGSATITYAATGCSTARATKSVFVKTIPDAGTISGMGRICLDSSMTLIASVAGGTWYSSNNLVATVSGGVVTGVMAGIDTIVYTVANSCGPNTTNKIDTIVAVPSSISGLLNVCVGAVDTLFNSSMYGMWISSDLGTATINVSSGLVTGFGAGSVTITYSTGCGVPTTTNVTVNSLPYASDIFGSSSVCSGSTITMTDSVTTGTWSSSNSSIATVSGGVVTAIASGVDSIVYIVATPLCGYVVKVKAITVNPMPVAGSIIGTDSICPGISLTLTATATGGVWRASDTNATVSGGVVTGVVSGIDTIYYTVASAYCGSDSTYKVVTIVPLPVAGVITGATMVCVASTDTLNDSIVGGWWSASSASVATISGNVVTGVSSGVVTVTYSVTNYCSFDTVSTTKSITVNALPNAGTIIGLGTSSILCIGTTDTLTDSISGGLWTVTNSNASITSSGHLAGISAGLDTVKYSVSTLYCGSATTSQTFNVLGLPNAGSIYGSLSVCLGSSATLVDTVSGGVWSSYSGSIATVTSTGVAHGVAFGIDTIGYSVANYCGVNTAKFAIAVDTPLTPNILGTTYICISGKSDTLVASPIGGTWAVSNSNAVLTGDTLSGQYPGLDTVSYTVVNSCGTRTQSISILVHSKHECDSINYVYVLNSDNSESIHIYPNPNSGTFTVELPKLGVNSSICIMDMYGKMIENREIKDNNIKEIEFNYNSLARGTYLIKIISDGVIYRGKVLIVE